MKGWFKLSSPQILVQAVRGSVVESCHRGHIAVVDKNRKLIASAGNPEHYTFARSTAKLLQAIPLLESGGDLRFQLDDQMIALICASHNGEDLHASLADQILRRLGLDESALRCGVHEPFHQETANRLKATGISPTPLRNNCSGKHSGMLALTRMMAPQQSEEPYTASTHPVQLNMLNTVAEMCGIPVGNITLGTDGCGVPVFAVPLYALAYAYARLGRPDGLPELRARACRQIIHSITRQPYYLAGSGRFDTSLIEVTGGRMIGKMGAEGIYALTIPEQGLGITIKIEDGASRALYPAVVETLIQLDMLRDEEIIRLKPFHIPNISNCNDSVVGMIRPTVELTPDTRTLP